MSTQAGSQIMPEKFFDLEARRLVYLKANASSEFWDQHWNEQDKVRLMKRPPRHRFICGVTNRYLPKGSRILEGGCGLGDKVRALQASGYEVVGVDFATDTVRWVNQNLPDLDVAEGDVMHLGFPNGSFDGYWSLGVIEHFYEGYSKILREAYRVLRVGGYFFLTFPAMNEFRYRNAKSGKYERWKETPERLERFYQFALDADQVVEACEAQGFELKKSRGIGSLKGLEDENNGGRLISGIRRLPFGGAAKLSVITDLMFGKQIAHSRLLVLRKAEGR
jgi:SAM-dependent methyltransferase